MSIYKGTQLISGVATPVEAGRNIGQIIQSLLPITDASVHLLDGTLLNGDGIYKSFVDYIKMLDLTASYFCTEEDWQASVINYGVCGKFVYDSVNNTVRLPKVTGIVEGTIDANALGDLVQAGLPNITGAFHSPKQTSANGAWQSGAFLTNSATGESNAIFGTSGDATQRLVIDFNASRSSSIYGNSTTVQPQTIKGYYYIVVATSIKTNIQVDIDNVATDLNGKADVDFSNVNSTGTSLASGWSMPSNNYINLTLGASGATYTAPANGWFYLTNDAGASNSLTLTNSTTRLGISTPNGAVGFAPQISIPAKKDDIVRASYARPSGSTTTIRFIYAQGEEV